MNVWSVVGIFLLFRWNINMTTWKRDNVTTWQRAVRFNPQIRPLVPECTEEIVLSRVFYMRDHIPLCRWSLTLRDSLSVIFKPPHWCCDARPAGRWRCDSFAEDKLSLSRSFLPVSFSSSNKHLPSVSCSLVSALMNFRGPSRTWRSSFSSLY